MHEEASNGAESAPLGVKDNTIKPRACEDGSSSRKCPMVAVGLASRSNWVKRTPSDLFLHLPCCSATRARRAVVLLGSDGVVVMLTGLNADHAFGLSFFVVFETVACTGVLTSCDGPKGAVAAGLRLSLGMTGFIDVVVELAFALQAIL